MRHLYFVAMRFSTWLRFVIALSAMWFLPACVYAIAVAELDAKTDRMDLSRATYQLEDPSGNLTLADVQKPENASRFTTQPLKIGSDAVWYRWTIANTSDVTLERWLDTGNRFLQEMDFYVPDELSGYRHISTGSRQRFGERPLPTNTFAFPVSIRAHQTMDV